MRSFKMLLSIIGIFLCLTGTAAFADSSGIVFDWEPFVAIDYMQLDHPAKKILPKKSLVPKEIFRKTDDIEELLLSDFRTTNDSSIDTTKQSVLDKIKITFSSVNSFMLPYDEIYPKDKEGKFSRATQALPSLVRSPSQGTAVETLKLIEPQINLGIEF
ncbi:MAG: hypothetical protein ABFD75_02090 [Smithella sp.]